MPRALPTAQTGLRGPGQLLFPEAAKEQGRRAGLFDEAVTIFKEEQTEDAGGDWSSTWVEQLPRVRGRIDPVDASRATGVFGDALRETTTHIVTLDPGVEVSTKDRLKVEGKMWTITAESFATESATTKLQVKEV